MDWRKIPSLQALRAFEAAARLQSFSKAAEELNVTHAAIAQHVRGLEAEFSESLIVRQGRGIVTTQAGVQLANNLRDGFSIIAAGVEQLRVLRSGRPLQISVTPTFAAHWLMPRIGEFWTKHPDIKVNINPNTDIVDLKNDGVDLAIRFGNSDDWPKLDTELLTHGDFWVVAHPDLIKSNDPACLQDVLGLPWLFEDYMRERVLILEQEDIDLNDADITLLGTNEMVISAVEAGLGLTMMTKALIENEVKTGRLQKICEFKQEGLGYHMVTIPDRENRELKIFRNWLRTTASVSED